MAQPQRHQNRTTAITTTWDRASDRRFGLSVLRRRLRFVHARSYALSVMPRPVLLCDRGRLASLEAHVRQFNIETSRFMLCVVKDTSSFDQQAELHVLSLTDGGPSSIIISALEAGILEVGTIAGRACVKF